MIKESLIVLSLFDGMSCGRIALERVGIEIDKYFASEVDRHSIKVSHHNYPNIIQIGDVRNIYFQDGVLYTPHKSYDIGKIDLMIGGSPCQQFSFAGKQQGASTKNKIEVTTLSHYLELKSQNFEFEGQSYLFWEYMRLLNEIKPKYFLLENVKMNKKWETVLNDAIGVTPININSSLVSAQSRERLYWSNIPNIDQPKDRDVSLEDILEQNVSYDVYYSNDSREYSNYDKNKVDKSINKITPIQIGNSKQFGNAVRNTNKAYTLRASNCNGILNEDYLIRKFTPIECERLQTVPDNYTEVASPSQRRKMLGNGWTVDVIAHILKGLKEGEES